jgi:hypothetical protein
MTVMNNTFADNGKLAIAMKVSVTADKSIRASGFKLPSA